MAKSLFAICQGSIRHLTGLYSPFDQPYLAMERLRDARGESFKAGVVLYAGAQTIPLGKRLWAVPVSGLWA